jgi:hypothetical protein
MSALDRIFRWTLALVLVAFAILLATFVGEAPALTMRQPRDTTYPAEVANGRPLGVVTKTGR